MIRSHFARGVSEPGDIKKRQFPKDGVGEKAYYHYSILSQNHIHVALIVTSVIIFMLFVQFCASQRS